MGAAFNGVQAMPCARGTSGGHALERIQMSRKTRRRDSVTTVKLRLEPVHTRKHMLSRARTQVQTCKCTTYVHAYIHTYKHEYRYTLRHTYIHTYIHACMHAYIHTYIPYERSSCRFHRRHELYRHDTSQTSFCSNSALLDTSSSGS